MNSMNDKFDKLDALILLAGDALIEEELAYAREVTDPELVISKRTDRQILNYIRHTQKKRTYHPVLEVMKRVAVAVLVICTVLFASAMSIDAVREKFWNAVVEWYEDYIAVMFVDDTVRDTMMDVEFEVREPSYLPEGVVKGEQIKKHRSCETIFYYNDKEILHLEQFIIANNNTKIDNTEYTVSNIEINEFKGILAEHLSQPHLSTIIWTDDIYCYKLISKATYPGKDEIILMLSSIYNK